MVLDNIRALSWPAQQRGSGVPIIVPIFTKCRQNLAEMEAWYDQWLRAWVRRHSRPQRLWRADSRRGGRRHGSAGRGLRRLVIAR